MQYVITAHDGTDPGAAARRQAARPAHLDNISPMVAGRNILLGGAILDDAGAMIGSVCIVDFPTRAALDHWLATDPYVTGGVWTSIDVKPFRVAVVVPAV